MRRSSKAKFLIVLALASLVIVSLLAGSQRLVGDGAISGPPDKVAPGNPVLGSRLHNLDARIESGEISVAEAARESPISLGDSVAVAIHVEGNSDDVAAFLQGNDGDPRNVREGYIEAYVPVPLLTKLSKQPGVVRVREIVPPRSNQGGATNQRTGEHGSPSWHEGGYRGQGIKVGIIDVGFKDFGRLMGTELPAQVKARCYTTIAFHSPSLWGCETTLLGIREVFAGSGDHGTMVAEALIDVAPEVSLYIANPYTPADIRDTVDWMIADGVSVINYSSGWLFGGPGDGTSPYANDPLRTVDRAVASGAVWVSAAGNEARRTWFGAYSDPDQDGYISFDTGFNLEENSMKLSSGDPVVVQLRWEDKWGGAASDLDLQLVSQASEWIDRDVIFGIGLPPPVRTLAATYFRRDGLEVASDDTQSGSPGDVPLEWLIFVPKTEGIYSLRIVHRSGPEPQWIQMMVSPGVVNQIGYHTWERSIISPAESSNPGMLAVGAAPWYNVNVLEPYSSRGPTPDGRVKPDIISVTCGESSLSPLNSRQQGFCGTSQAAPHVAGMAALVRQRFPNYGPEEVVEYLKGHAEQKGDEHPNNSWGHGLARLPELGSGCQRTLAIEGLNFGGWAEGCSSQVHGRGYAQYYSLVVLQPARVTLSLESGDADPYLYLRSGYVSTGPPLYENNDMEPGHPGSQIAAELRPGTYTLEATTRLPGQTGSFTLEVQVGQAASNSQEDGTKESLDVQRSCISAEDLQASGNNPDALELPLCDDTFRLGQEGIAADRAALVALYHATDGPNWIDSTNWLSEKPLRSWYGVLTDESGRVIQVHVRENGLSGSIPAEIGNMEKLKGLDLEKNRLTGDIPSSMSLLTNLEYVELNGNLLTGGLEHALGDLPKLKRLILKDNQFSGEIPVQLAQLTSLEWLDLSHNDFTGEIPEELGALSNLRILWLGGNRLEGEIPVALADLDRLESLGLGSNQLTGEIPEELGNMSNLEQLMLLQNRLEGEIPAELGMLSNLSTLFLDHNNLSGDIPQELGYLYNLDFLQLHPNALTGCIPHGLRDVKENDDLSLLDLPFCKSTNEPLPVPRTCVSAEDLQASGNDPEALGLPVCEEASGQDLEGIAADRAALVALYHATRGPEWIDNTNWLSEKPLWSWHHVRTDDSGRVIQVHLDGNGLSGTIPAEVGNMKKLRELDLSQNWLTGEIPPSLSLLTNLEVLNLGWNLLTGGLERGLEDLPNLEWLLLEGNQFGGEIPVELAQLTSLQWVYLGHNDFIGEIPAELGMLSNLRFVQLQGNRLEGEIPVALANLDRLQLLNLADNRLTGEIPKELGNMSSLQELKLFDNGLSGEIPAELGMLSNLSTLFLNNNNLSGDIPQELGNLYKLESLELYGNALSGCIPHGLRDLKENDNLSLLDLPFCKSTN